MASLFETLTQSDRVYTQANELLERRRFWEARSLYQQAHMLRPSTKTHYGLGLVSEALGHQEEAAGYYLDALTLDYRNLEARVNLANLLRNRGDVDEALHHHLVAYGLSSCHALTLYNLAQTHLRRGAPLVARDLLERCLALHPDFVLAERTLQACDRSAPWPDHSMCDEARFAYDKALDEVQRGNIDAALDAFEAITATFEPNATILVDYGNALLAHGRADRAIACHNRAIAIDPRCAAAYHNLGAALQTLSRHAEAIEAYSLAISFCPSVALSWFNLGLSRRECGRLDFSLDAFQMAAYLKEPYPEALIELAAAARLLRRTENAIEAMGRLEKLWPDNFVVLNNLGAYLLDDGKADEALACFERAMPLDDLSPLAAMNMAAVFELKREFGRALECYREALKRSPNDPSILTRNVHVAQHQCDWRDIDELFARIRVAIGERRLKGVQPFSLLAVPGLTLADQLACARVFAEESYGRLRALRLPKRSGRQPTADRIRVGYLSCDLYDHATAWLLAEVIELHDRSTFEVSAFSYGPSPEDATRARLRKAFDHFIDITHFSDERAAVLIYEHKIDILVDLKGYTQGTRTGILALRPAPVQINYLGFPGSLGADFADYIICDNVTVPEQLEYGYTETALRMPGCYQPNDRKRPFPPVPPRATVGLPPHTFTFCAFNNLYKITPDMFDVWCGLLHETEDSILWLTSSNEQANINLRAEAVRRGIAGDRLVFAPRTDLAAHLARFRLADLFLDTFPCTAHTTASDALWCGVPVVTRIGETFASRVAASLLQAVGLPELIAENADHYYEIARAIIKDRARLASLKAHLEHNRLKLPLFDSISYTRNLERLYMEALKGADTRGP